MFHPKYFFNCIFKFELQSLQVQSTICKKFHSKSFIPPKIEIPGVDQIIAVSSAKGGVGKSTTAVNIALSLSLAGKKVGIMDADVFGPSIPLLMNLQNTKPQTTKDNFFIPLSNFGVKCNSMGFLIPEDSPTIFRGPRVMKAVDQLLRETEWGQLDTLIVDMPPGTGDVQLTMVQNVPLTGAIIVSTPQDIALIDTLRGINMYNTVDVPIIGIIENMSYFTCPSCSHKSYLFGEEGARKMAKEKGVDFLGEIPLSLSIRETSDAGKPIVISDPNSEQAKNYLEITNKVLDKLEVLKSKKSNLDISVE